MSKEGYGSFEKCLAVLTACNGDTNKAKGTLNKVTKLKTQEISSKKNY